jgi:PhzF family phenazine biosynthesis protein
MRSRAFRQVDVFGAAPMLGNPLAVVHDAEGLTAEEMLAFTRWANLSETTFLLPPSTPEADYRVRIFTLAGELPFAGHPTLGSCHAWLEAGGQPRDAGMVVQECGAGLVSVRRDAATLAFAAPPLRREGPLEPDALADVAAVLRIDPAAIVAAAWVDNGPGWMAVQLADAEAVLAVEAAPEAGGIATDIGLVGVHPPGSDAAYEVRALFSDAHGRLREDPVTGSLNASLAQWLLDRGEVTAPYVASQGARLGHRGRIAIDRDDDGRVWVGGATTTVVVGEVAQP